jgi:hypothetical protein
MEQVLALLVWEVVVFPKALPRTRAALLFVD